jgi:enamine deaminase RidA (YjgF/YER057c/UK114 family)
VSIIRRTPPGLHPTPGYHHVNETDSRTTIYFAGQCPVTPDDQVVEGDVFAQVDQVIRNTATALVYADVRASDVVRTVVYVRSDEQPVLSAVWSRFKDSEIGEAFTTASTLVGVSQLGYPGQLVELDVTAVGRGLR